MFSLEEKSLAGMTTIGRTTKESIGLLSDTVTDYHVEGMRQEADCKSLIN
jgi:hypothetical protein